MKKLIFFILLNFQVILFFGFVSEIKLQKDGKILVAGGFKQIGGDLQSNFARLLEDGTLDPSFKVDVNSGFSSFEIQEDGKIIIGGNFTMVNGVEKKYLARLNMDGSLDNSFNFELNKSVKKILIQPDGKILVGGDFTSIPFYQGKHLVRINPNGTLDIYFKADLNGTIYDLALQEDGKIIVTGNFTEVDGYQKSRIVRLKDDGRIDLSFNINTSEIISSIALEPEGNILLGGCIHYINQTSVYNLVRVFPNGILDRSFKPKFDGCISKILLQKDGNILVGGYFINVNEEFYPYIVRITPEGEIDKSFKTKPDYSVYELALSKENTIYMGGKFERVNDITRTYIAKINLDGSLDESFNANAYIKWIPVATNLKGGYESNWKTDLSIKNLSKEIAKGKIYFYYEEGNLNTSLNFEIDEKNQILIKDIVGKMGINGYGSIKVISNQEFLVGAKIYHQIPDNSSCLQGGTFGQYFKGYTIEESLKNIRNYFFHNLSENNRYRTNLNLTNITNNLMGVQIELYNKNGELLSNFVIHLNPSEYRQEAQIFKNRAGISEIEGGMIKVKIFNVDGLLASASVVDNITNDSILIFPQDTSFHY